MTRHLQITVQRTPWLLAIGLLALVLTACGNDKDTLTIYSGRSETLVAPIIQQFSEASGIDVVVKYGSTPEMAATLLEEGDRSPADLFFAQDPGGLGAVEAMLAPLSGELLEQVPAWARSSQSTWVGVSGRARVLVYNTSRLTPADLPYDLFVLTDPQWKGRIGWAPTNGSFQAMVTGMRALWGEEETLQWLQAIQQNSPRTYPNNSTQVAAAAAGEIDVGLVNHYYLYRFLAEEGDAFPARNYYLPAGGPGSLVMVAGAGILSTSDQAEQAEWFLAFMLSPVAQQYFASQTFEYPLVDGIKTHRDLLPLAQINKPEISVGDLTDLTGTQRLLREAGIVP